MLPYVFAVIREPASITARDVSKIPQVFMAIPKGPVHRPLAPNDSGDCLFARFSENHLDGSLHLPLPLLMLLNRGYSIQPRFGEVKNFLQEKKVSVKTP